MTITGPRLLAALALAIAIMTAAILAFVSPADVAAHTLVRWTGRTSLLLFSLAYVARPLVQLLPSRWTKRLLRERKWLGLAFAASHTSHLFGLVLLAIPDVRGFVLGQPPQEAVAAVAFVGVYIVAVTSIDAVRRAMSARTWQRVHRAGIHLIWVVFLGTYVELVPERPLATIPALAILALGGVRFAAYMRHVYCARRAVAATAG
jgi:DMSO/TMAO reductase YedYZ heme-binding membrane subunit